MKRFNMTLLISIIFITILGQISNPAFAETINLNWLQDFSKIKNTIEKNKAEKIPVLTYHHLLKQEDIDTYGWSKNSCVLSVETFEKQMKYLHDNKFYTASLDELKDFIDGNTVLPKKTVVITFDDGYLSNVLYAYPIMKKYNFKGTIFMIGHGVDAPQKPFDPKSTQSISIYEISNYTDVFSFASHTYDLHKKDKNQVSVLISSKKEIILNDLAKSKDLLSTNYFAYPYGKYDNNTIEYLKDTGYEMAFTVKPGYVSKGSNKYTLPRFGIAPYISFENFIEKVNGNWSN